MYSRPHNHNLIIWVARENIYPQLYGRLFFKQNTFSTQAHRPVVNADAEDTSTHGLSKSASIHRCSGCLGGRLLQPRCLIDASRWSINNTSYLENVICWSSHLLLGYVWGMLLAGLASLSERFTNRSLTAPPRNEYNINRTHCSLWTHQSHPTRAARARPWTLHGLRVNRSHTEYSGCLTTLSTRVSSLFLPHVLEGIKKTRPLNWSPRRAP